MGKSRTPRMIRVGEFERVGCKCKHRDCALRAGCRLNLWQDSGAQFLPQLDSDIVDGFETPAQVRVYCLNYKEESGGKKEGGEAEGQESQEAQAEGARVGEAGADEAQGD